MRLKAIGCKAEASLLRRFQKDISKKEALVKLCIAIPVIFNQCFDAVMNIGIGISIQKYDNPEAGISIFLTFRVQFFL